MKPFSFHVFGLFGFIALGMIVPASCRSGIANMQSYGYDYGYSNYYGGDYLGGDQFMMMPAGFDGSFDDDFGGDAYGGGLMGDLADGVIALGFRRRRMVSSADGDPFAEHNIVPDMLASRPTKILDVVYEAPNSRVNMGNSLGANQTLSAPKVSYEHDPKQMYTLVQIDLDSLPDVHVSALNYLVVNIPGDQVNKGKVIALYAGPGPSRDSIPHRVVVAVYKQTQEIKSSQHIDIHTIKPRMGFPWKDFVAKNKLDPTPVAANFYMSTFDCGSNILYKQFKLTFKIDQQCEDEAESSKPH